MTREIQKNNTQLIRVFVAKIVIETKVTAMRLQGFNP